MVNKKIGQKDIIKNTNYKIIKPIKIIKIN